MKANFHTHTSLCGHATGEIKEYIQCGIDNGLEILGFSDHIPYPNSVGFVSDIRMKTYETEKYVNDILSAKEKYKNQIQILLGFESEFFPKEFDRMIKNISKYPVDYMILGQHYTKNEYDGQYVGITATENLLTEYVNQTIDGMKTKMFTYLAHPDLVNYPVEDFLYKEQMKKLCETALSLDIPLEFNILGFKLNRDYPTEKFWKIASSVGNKVVLGCDAHYPQDTGDKALAEAATKYLAAFNIIPTEDIILKSI